MSGSSWRTSWVRPLEPDLNSATDAQILSFVQQVAPAIDARPERTPS